MFSSLCFGAFSLCWNASNCVSLIPILLHPLIPHPLITLTRFPGTIRAKGTASALLDRSGAFAETLARPHNPFSPILTPTHGPPGPPGEAARLQEASQVLRATSSAAVTLRAAQVAPDTVGAPPVSARGTPHGELGTVQWGCGAGVSLGSGDALSSVSGEKHSAEVNPFRSSSQTRDGPEETVNKSYNPFLD